jgi:UDP-N-acetylmuramate dehydrogenase
VTVSFENLQGELIMNETLSKYTSWRVGGMAKQIFKPTDVNDLVCFMNQLDSNEPILWIGLGSNLLVRDGGFNGTVIVMAGALQALEVKENIVIAEAGVYCSKLAKTAAKSGLTGAAFLAGIPGTIGGALAMNAGAHKSDTWSHVRAVSTINRQGQIKRYLPEDFDIGYRHVKGRDDEWFISAEFQFAEGDADAELQEIKTLLKRRNVTQPTNQPCAGSVFRNPENDFAGRIIESMGLKGLRVGGAYVSDKHANFIVSEPDATARDIEELISTLQAQVETAHGIKLVPEVHIVGEA